MFCDINGKKEMVWDGFASMKLKKYKENQGKAIDNLVALIGKNYEGDLRISNHSKSGKDDVEKAINELIENTFYLLMQI